MNLIPVKVVRSTATEVNNHLIKLISDKSVTSGLLTVTSRKTYYAFSPTPLAIDAETEIDLDLFNVVVKDHVTEDGTNVKLNYLLVK